MIAAPTNWASLWGAAGTVMEVALAIGGKTYGNSDMASDSLKITHQLYGAYSIGNASAAKLSASVFEEGDMPSGAARATLKVRLSGGGKSTAWVSQGVFYLDTAEKTEDGLQRLTLYDGLALADRPLYDGGEVPTGEIYPRAASSLVAAICSLCGLTADTVNKAMWQNVSCTAPEGMTCRQVLQSVAAAAGGNWTMTKAGKLRFVPLASLATASASGYTASVAHLSETSARKTVTGVSLTDGRDTFERGTDSFMLAATSEFSSDEASLSAYNRVRGCQYQGFKASGALLTPLVELGDLLAVEGSNSKVFLDSVSATYQSGLWGEFSSPLVDEVERRIAGDAERNAKLRRIAYYAKTVDDMQARLSTDEYVEDLLGRLNAVVNETGGYAYLVQGVGIRTYDAPVSDPAVGSEATMAVEVKGGNIRIANSKKNGEWEWKTLLQSGHIAAEMVTASNITAGFIGSPAGNYWNLDTGELRMAYDAVYTDEGGAQHAFGDYVEAASRAAADSVAVGGTNLLNGTGTLAAVGAASRWEDGTWRGASGGTAARKIVDVTDAPNSNIRKGVQIAGNGTASDLCQDGVPAIAGQSYLVSCYAKGKGRLFMQAGSDPYSSVAADVNHSTWKRYYFRFEAGKGNAAVSNGRLSVFFGNRGSGTLTLCGMKMERGNKCTDWSPSPDDGKRFASDRAQDALTKAEATADAKATNAINVSKAFAKSEAEAQAKKFSDAVGEQAKLYADKVRDDLDHALNMQELVKRLNGGSWDRKGFFIQNGVVYTNADYVRSGVLDAGIIRTGTLSDMKGSNTWDMVNGLLTTRSLDVKNGRVSGSLQNGVSGNIMKLENGQITGWQDSGRTYCGYIDFSASMKDLKTGRRYKGIQLAATGGVRISSPKLAVRDTSNVRETAIYGFTGTIRLNNVTFNTSRDMKRSKTGSVELEFINGIFIGLGAHTDGLTSQSSSYKV